MDPSSTDSDWDASMSVQDSAMVLKKEAATIAAEAADTINSIFSAGNSWMSSLSGGFVAPQQSQQKQAMLASTSGLQLDDESGVGNGEEDKERTHTITIGLGADMLHRLKEDMGVVQKRLGVEADDTVLESFVCSLLQTYRSITNSFTPELRLEARGILIITSAGRAVFGDMREGPCVRAAFDVPADAIRCATKIRNRDARGTETSIIRVELSDVGDGPVGPSSIELSKFESCAELEECLALLEHLCDFSSQAIEEGTPEVVGENGNDEEEKG